MKHLIKVEYLMLTIETESPEELQALFTVINKLRVCEQKDYQTPAVYRILNREITIESNGKHSFEDTP